MARSLRAFGAISAVVGLLWASTSPLAAAGRPALAFSAVGQTGVRADGRRVSSKSGFEELLPGLDMKKVRAELETDRVAGGTKASRASRLLMWLDIAEARTPTERHEMIRRLPVTVVESAATDGRVGTVKKYVMKGKTRLALFVPANPDLGRDALSGPSAGTRDDCYDGPEPCVTWSDMDDLVIEVVAGQDEVNYQDAELSSYCGMYPEDCHSPGQDQIGGPSSFVPGPCSEKAWDALVQLGQSAFAIGAVGVEVYGGITAGLTLTTAGWFVVIGVPATAAFAAGYYVGKWMACKGIEPVPQITSPADEAYLPSARVRPSRQWIRVSRSGRFEPACA